MLPHPSQFASLLRVQQSCLYLARALCRVFEQHLVEGTDAVDLRILFEEYRSVLGPVSEANLQVIHTGRSTGTCSLCLSQGTLPQSSPARQLTGTWPLAS